MNRPELIAKHAEQLKDLDHKNFETMADISVKINENVKARVVQQQTLLQQAGLIEFYETEDEGVMIRQMAILELLVAMKKGREGKEGVS